MKGFFKNPVIAFLSSLKLSAVLMAVVAIASAKATFIESSVGRDGAYALVYDAWWFEVLLGLVTISLILLFFKRWPYRPRQWGFTLVHISIVVILIGAAITRHFGYEGIMAIREGATVDYVYSDKKHVQAEMGGEVASYPVRVWKPGLNDISQEITLGGRKYRLAVSEYWPHYTEIYQEGPGGPPAVQYGVRQNGQIADKMLVAGDKTTIGQADVRFLHGDFSGDVAASRYGDLRLNIAGESCTFPVAPGDEREFVCGGYRFRITEFQTRFTVGGQSDPEGPLTNPMIRVAVTSPDGRQGERVLFAYHPDFSMGHSGGQDEFAELNMLYQVNRGIEFARGGQTGLLGRATFPLAAMDMNTNEEFDVAAGEIFPVRTSVFYRNDANEFSFVPVRIYESVVLAPAMSDNANAPGAVRLVLSNDQGEQAAAVCVEQSRPQTVTLGGQRIGLSFGPVIRRLPYSVTLDDFVLQTYPGSDNPATYESYVTLDDPGKGIAGRKVHIYMNHPLTHRGSKHFQSSYDRDRKGTVLSVNHDPGKWPTYFGYGLITLGFIMIMLKDVLFRAKKVKAVGEVRTAAAASMTALLLTLGAGGALAQTSGHSADDGHDHSGHDHATVGFVPLSEPVREAASRLIIQDFRGRMKPLDTLAREMVMKVAKRSKFEGREPVDQYLSWSLNPNFWWDKPLIAVRYAGLKDLLGVGAEVKHVSAASLFNAQGNYRLNELVEEAHRTPDPQRTKTQRKLISFDERFQMLYMTFRGSSLRLFPVPGDANNTWLDIQQVKPRLSASAGAAYGAAFDALAQGMRSGDITLLNDGVARTRALQQQYGAEVLPSPGRVRAELIYNRAHLFSWMMIPLLVAFCVLMLVFLWNLFRNGNRRLTFRNPLYAFGLAVYVLAFAGLIYAYVLRWVASGRAPLSNGHESLLFISLAVALAGLIFELVYRLGAAGSLGGLLTTVILGVSMLSAFDPAIGPLVPVLVSYWLNIHVTVITASYGFLGLSALIGALTLVLLMTPARGQENVQTAIKTLDGINKHVVITGLGLLTVGTLLGGVWANESWGRYWGWDPKETWSLITILVYAVVLHFRWIPATRSVWLNASASTAAISSVVMTYFGVNYFLSGLHSYAQGDAARVPSWVYIGVVIIVGLIAVSGLVNRGQRWEAKV